jgi:hypothetical protein
MYISEITFSREVRLEELVLVNGLLLLKYDRKNVLPPTVAVTFTPDRFDLDIAREYALANPLLVFLNGIDPSEVESIGEQFVGVIYLNLSDISAVLKTKESAFPDNHKEHSSSGSTGVMVMQDVSANWSGIRRESSQKKEKKQEDGDENKEENSGAPMDRLEKEFWNLKTEVNARFTSFEEKLDRLLCSLNQPK